ncbi:hypothetical protein AAFF_G00247180 [Aldrovandia affinis]|uniref:Uncharacterized protein n=1 Tax=Aldrovandia affinis TaxID=143900 RepID=A0AAD7WTY2_9TELE|nr:hypothetical protein AAFF_G00247180 [Aldrovandia affinis]
MRMGSRAERISSNVRACNVSRRTAGGGTRANKSPAEREGAGNSRGISVPQWGGDDGIMPGDMSLNARAPDGHNGGRPGRYLKASTFFPGHGNVLDTQGSIGQRKSKAQYLAANARGTEARLNS